MDGPLFVQFVLSTRSVLVGQGSLALKDFPIIAFGAPGLGSFCYIHRVHTTRLYRRSNFMHRRLPQ